MTVLAEAFEKRNKKKNKVEATKALKLPMDVHAELPILRGDWVLRVSLISIYDF